MESCIKETWALMRCAVNAVENSYQKPIVKESLIWINYSLKQRPGPLSQFWNKSRGRLI